LLDLLKQQGITTCGIGKISDLFAGEGLTFSYPTKNNVAGMQQTLLQLDEINQGLIMTNLVDFDMLYGHRLDSDGFALALRQFDDWLPTLLEKMLFDDLLIITADHGCDPTTPGTDHSREYVPLMLFSRAIAASGGLGIRDSFADVGATIAGNFQIQLKNGESFLS
jgi:phosphopentomutase